MWDGGGEVGGVGLGYKGISQYEHVQCGGG